MRFTYTGDEREYPHLPQKVLRHGDVVDLERDPGDGRFEAAEPTTDSREDEPDGSSFFVAQEQVPGALENAEEAN